MKKILIATLGNRDLQLPPSALVKVSIQEHFERGGTDTQDNLIVKKTSGSFLKNSRAVFDEYEHLGSQVCFPMVETYIKKIVERPDMIVLVSTCQEPLDSQDCYYIAKFLQLWLEKKGYAVDFYPIECAPVNFPELVEVFSTLYDGYRDAHIFVGNSGGTPDMRAASYAAGFFRGIQFITLQARDNQVNLTNFRSQEKLVLRHIVENMLLNFDYSGILQLPIEDENIKLLAEYALARLSLDFSNANVIAKKIGNTTFILPSNVGIREKEREVWVSAKIKFKQKAWGDYLWRLFLIQENLWIPLIEEKLGGTIVFDKNSGFKEWKVLISKNSKLLSFLKQQEFGFPKPKPLEYEKPTKVVFEYIVKFFNKGNALQSNVSSQIFFEINKILDYSVRNLRNSVAHNYAGISLDTIVTELKKNSKITISDFHQKLETHTGISEDSFGIYDEINRKILEYFIS